MKRHMHNLVVFLSGIYAFFFFFLFNDSSPLFFSQQHSQEMQFKNTGLAHNLQFEGIMGIYIILPEVSSRLNSDRGANTFFAM